MRLFFLIVFLTAVSFWHIRKLIKAQLTKELYVFSGLMVLASYLSIAALLNLYIPNPTNGLKLIFQPVQHWVDNLLS